MINKTIIVFLLTVIYSESVISVDFLANRNNSQIFDLSGSCINFNRHEYFLPFGTGATDGLVILITDTKERVYCTLNFNIRQDSDQFIQIIVVEFLPSLLPYDEVLESCNTSFRNLFVTFQDNREAIAIGCEMFTKSIYGNPHLVYLSSLPSLTLQLNSYGHFGGAKITATAGHSLVLGENCAKNELECTISHKAVCIDKRLQCNGHINCGVYEDQDEDHKICRAKEYSNYWLIALAGVAIVVLVYGIFVYCIKLHITKTAGTFFIFNEDKENKLVIRSQWNTHEWREYKKEVTTEPTAVTTSEATAVKENEKV